ncbi:MAG: energy-coupling factor transporter transmembrane component T [Bacillota bacterium]|nr:energy-coupling factor transporter transmembrane component T [Bacillota bacterium]
MSGDKRGTRLKRNAFSEFHPMVNFVYFLLIFSVAALVSHPLVQGVSFCAAVSYFLSLKGGRELCGLFLFLLPLSAFAVAINVFFHHEGVTILFYLHDGNPVTEESIYAALGSVLSIVSLIIWVMCYAEVMTSDKWVYLFGRVLPAMSLILSMTLRFVPLYKRKYIEVREANAVMLQHEKNSETSSGTFSRFFGRIVLIFRTAAQAVKTVSIVTTWALENAVDTADSMKSRGYGLPKRTAYSIFEYHRRDKWVLGFCLYSAFVLIFVIASGGFSWRYFPTIRTVGMMPVTAYAMVIYTALCFMPIMIHYFEERAWRRKH